ncbi:hypothetical protein ACWECC_38940, partial [Streptomyces microflavus]
PDQDRVHAVEQPFRAARITRRPEHRHGVHAPLIGRDFTATAPNTKYVGDITYLPLEAVAYALNNRPRKTLGWKTPAEVFEEQLRSLQQHGVATTG